MSDNYAQEIRENVKKFKNKHDRQSAFKQDIECFGIQYRKSKSSARKMGIYKAKEIKEVSGFVKENRKKTKDRI